MIVDQKAKAVINHSFSELIFLLGYKWKFSIWFGPF
jgi:hypothetical protein